MLDLILAGILSLPALLVIVATMPFLLLLSAPAAYLLLSRHHINTKRNTPPKKKNMTKTKGDTEEEEDELEQQQQEYSYHVIVTGGSSGIGLAIAQLCMSQNNVHKITLLARDPKKLEAARETVLLMRETIATTPDKSKNTTIDSKTTKVVQTFSVDVSDYKAVQDAALEIFSNSKRDRVLLFCCAGEAIAEHFDKLTPEQFFKQIQVNQLGCMHIVHAFLPFLAENSTISLCSSAAGQVGVFGYAAYCPTKFALRGFAEALHAELLDTNINVQVAFPPDTDTPGFATENKTKPRECHLISEHVGLANPETVGRTMLSSAMKQHPPFLVYFDLDGFLLSSLTSGFSPVTSYFDALVQLSGLMTLVRWVALFYLRLWHSIIRKCRAEKNTLSETTKKDVVLLEEAAKVDDEAKKKRMGDQGTVDDTTTSSIVSD